MLGELPDNYQGYECYDEGGDNDTVLYNICCSSFIDFQDYFFNINWFLINFI